jgi:hypothetical protein
MAATSCIAQWFLVYLDVLPVEILYHVDVKRHASSIAMAGPLRVLSELVHVAAASKEACHLPDSLVCFDIILLTQFFHLLLLQSLFCIGKLANCAVDVKLSSSEVPSGEGQRCQLLQG